MPLSSSPGTAVEPGAAAILASHAFQRYSWRSRRLVSSSPQFRHSTNAPTLAGGTVMRPCEKSFWPWTITSSGLSKVSAPAGVTSSFQFPLLAIMMSSTPVPVSASTADFSRDEPPAL